ncbi:MAG: bifunctional oligoribonuclease/PAP phosphatase NrnA [Clostridia bacterium]|nr:bifunctional oligoribonuclease/PAP phosphatase NrnA [Clostridia bacterium]
MENIIKALERAEKILILTHINPDGDAVGSCYAVKKALERAGKQADIVLNSKLGDEFGYFEDSVLYTVPEKDYDLILSVDCGDLKRLGDLGKYYEGETANIDHHYSNDNFGKYNYVDGGAAAAGEIVYDLINKMEIPFDKEIASGIYVALLTDTGGFMFSNTSSKTHNIIAEMMKYGIDFYDFNNMFMQEKTYKKLKITAYCIERMEFYHNGKCCVCVLDNKACKSEKIENSDLNGIAALPRSVRGVEVGALITEAESGKVKVSLRSDKIVDVSQIAAKFGGGGHVRASGITVPGGNLAELKEQLIKEIEIALEENNL